MLRRVLWSLQNPPLPQTSLKTKPQMHCRPHSETADVFDLLPFRPMDMLPSFVYTCFATAAGQFRGAHQTWVGFTLGDWQRIGGCQRRTSLCQKEVCGDSLRPMGPRFSNPKGEVLLTAWVEGSHVLKVDPPPSQSPRSGPNPPPSSSRLKIDMFSLQKKFAPAPSAIMLCHIMHPSCHAHR